jgi:hypothetical protein
VGDVELVEAAGLALATPTSTSMPAARRAAAPRPSTPGLGSTMATTQRVTPAAITASTHGGVRPWWAQGSRVT